VHEIKTFNFALIDFELSLIPQKLNACKVLVNFTKGIQRNSSTYYGNLKSFAWEQCRSNSWISHSRGPVEMTDTQNFVCK